MSGFTIAPTNLPDPALVWRPDIPGLTEAGAVLVQKYDMDPGPCIVDDPRHRANDWCTQPVGAFDCQDGSGRLYAFDDRSALIVGRSASGADIFLPMVFILWPPPSRRDAPRLAFSGVLDGVHDPIFEPLTLGLAPVSHPVTTPISQLRNSDEDPSLKALALQFDHEVASWAGILPCLPDIRHPDPDDGFAPLNGVDPITQRAYDWPAILPVNGLTQPQRDVFHAFLHDLVRFCLIITPERKHLCLHFQPCLPKQDGVTPWNLDFVNVDSSGENASGPVDDIVHALVPLANSLLKATSPVNPWRATSIRRDYQYNMITEVVGGRFFTSSDHIAQMSAHERLRIEGRFRSALRST